MATDTCIGFDTLLDRLLSDMRQELSQKHYLDMQGLIKRIDGTAQRVDFEASFRVPPAVVQAERMHSMVPPAKIVQQQNENDPLHSGAGPGSDSSNTAPRARLSQGPRQSQRASMRQKRIPTSRKSGNEDMEQVDNTEGRENGAQQGRSSQSATSEERIEGGTPAAGIITSSAELATPQMISSSAELNAPQMTHGGTGAGRKRTWCEALFQPNKPDATSRVVWDVVMCAVMVMLILVETTSFAIPEWQEGTFADLWAVFLLLVFSADVMINFNTALVWIVGRKVVVIYDRGQIAKAYLKGWLIVDVFSTFPFDMLLGSVMSASNARMLKFGKILRLARLVKGFIKIAKLMQHWGEIQDRIQEKFLDLIGCQGYLVDKAVMYISRAWALVFSLLLEAHTFSCLFLILTMHVEGISWHIDGVSIIDLDPFPRYIAAMRHIVYVLLTGTLDRELLGFGDILVMVLLLWFYVQLMVVVALFVGIKTDRGDGDGDFTKKCSRLKRYLRHHGVIKRVRDEVDSHLSKVGKYVGMNLDSLLDELPSSIRQSVSAGLYYPFYNNMAFFMQDSSSHDGFEYDICAEIESVFYRPHDTVVCTGSTLGGLHYLSEGYAAITRAVANEGEQESDWSPGTYLFLEGLFAPKSHVCATGQVEAIEPCEVWFLARTAFDKALQETDPVFRNVVEMVRSSICFNDDLHVWCMEITNEDNDVQYFGLDYLVDDGLHPHFRKEAEKLSCAANGKSSAERASGSFGNLPAGKRFHYFLSHRKLHTKLGNRPELIAQGLHDALTAKGFTGFFDIDNLVEISAPVLEQAVEDSCGMIVVLNDETAGSEWCRLEWECAARYGIPVKCVVDSQHCPKAELLDNIRDVNKALLEYQWSEYLDRYRKSVAQDLDDWLLSIMQRQATVGQSGSEIMAATSSLTKHRSPNHSANEIVVESETTGNLIL